MEKFYFDKRLVGPLMCLCVCVCTCCAIEISFIEEGKEVSCATVMSISVCVSLFDWHPFLSGCPCSDLNSLALDPSYAQAVKALEISEVGHTISLKVN